MYVYMYMYMYMYMYIYIYTHISHITRPRLGGGLLLWWGRRGRSAREPEATFTGARARDLIIISITITIYYQ